MLVGFPEYREVTLSESSALCPLCLRELQSPRPDRIGARSLPDLRRKPEGSLSPTRGPSEQIQLHVRL